MTPVFKVSPFGNPRITARLPAPHGLSQVTTSFIGSWCLGIHRSHLVACQKSTKMLASTVKFSRNKRHHNHPDKQVQATMARKKKQSLAQPSPQDPTTCSGQPPPTPKVPLPHPKTGAVLTGATQTPASGQCSTIQNQPTPQHSHGQST